IGDVVHGVFLREPRIFLGGSGGLVGPGQVGYGAIVGAGQVVRRTVQDRKLVLEPTPSIDTRRDPGYLDGVEPRTQRNVAYIGQLVALHRFYKHVRRPRIQPPWGVNPNQPPWGVNPTPFRPTGAEASTPSAQPWSLV